MPQQHILVATSFLHFMLPALCSPASLFQSTQILVADSFLVLFFIWTQIPIFELFPCSPPCLTTPESEEKTDSHSWLCTLTLLIRKSNCWANLVPAFQPQGREWLPWVVSSENLSAKLRWVSPKYHIMSPATYQGLTRISLDFLRSCMHVFLREQTEILRLASGSVTSAKTSLAVL